MSYKQVSFSKDGKPYNYAEFLCDTDDDINNLPTNENGKCAIGSMAFVVSSSSKYVLSPLNKWVVCNLEIGGDI